jgi:RNA polymerase sigma-54 factor
MRGVLDELRGLKPRLDCSRATPESDYVREEIRIVEEEGELRVDVTNRYLPTLRISRQYRDMLDDPAVDDETKSYIREKIRAAAFLMNSLSQRQSTLERIVTAVLEAQQEFFREGFSRLKPLTMSQIARDIGVHETTISRGVAAKYLRCSHGMIPLRSLFTAGYEDRDGNSVSNAVVKNRIREMVEHEDPGAPLSDSRIAENLTEQGLQVARRTVAKYREAMKILPSNQRRQYWAEAR